MMKYLILKFMAVFFLAVCLPAWAQEKPVPAPAFFESLSDIPVMPGLRELRGQTVVFDKPEGRIIEMMAAGDSLSPDSVSAFYRAALPQVGWRPVGPHAYERQSERLSLSYDQNGSRNFVRFTLVPAP